MLLDGEVHGAGAADLVRLFVATTGADETQFPPKDTTMVLRRHFGGISLLEMASGTSNVAISLYADRSKPAHVESPSGEDDLSGERLEQCRNLLQQMEFACS